MFNDLKTETVICNLCNDSEYKLLKNIEFQSHLFTVVECSSCKLRYMRHRPALESANIINGLNYLDEKSLDKEKYLTEKEINRLSSRNQETIKQRLIETIRPIKKLIKINQDSRLLDIGCGGGLSLDIATQIGFSCYGIEPSEKATEKLKYPIFNSMDEVIDRGLRFDVVLLSAVIEHLPDPKTILDKIVSILAKDGILVIFTDNDRSLFVSLGSLLNRISNILTNRLKIDINIKDNKLEKYFQRRVYKNNVQHLRPVNEDSLSEFAAANLQHVFFFNPGTLKNLLSESGYDIVFYPSGFYYKPFRTTRKLLQNGFVNRLAKTFGMQMNIVYYCRKNLE